MLVFQDMDSNGTDPLAGMSVAFLPPNTTDASTNSTGDNSILFSLQSMSDVNTTEYGSSPDPAGFYQLAVTGSDQCSFCATFGWNPPSFLTFEECGNSTNGGSQVFSYNATSGELAPIWGNLTSEPGTWMKSNGTGQPVQMDSDGNLDPAHAMNATVPQGIILHFVPAENV